MQNGQKIKPVFCTNCFFLIFVFPQKFQFNETQHYSHTRYRLNF